MHKTSEVFDFHSYFVDKEVDKKIKANKDDVLHIVQTDIKLLNAKFDSLSTTMQSENKRLDEKIDNRFQWLGDKIDNLVTLVKWLSTLVKWLVGIFVTIILAAVALFGTDIASLFGR